MPNLTYLCGPPGCGNTTRLLARYLDHVAAHGSDSVLWLAPDADTAGALRQRATRELAGLYDPRILTFPALAHSLLNANHAAVRELEPAQRELIIRELAAAPEVGLPPKLVASPGFIRALSHILDELKRAAIHHADFQRALQRHFPGDDRTQSLGRFYAAYQGYLEGKNLFDEPGLFWWARSFLADGKRAPFGDVSLVLVDGFTDFTTTQLQVLHHLSQAADETIISLPLADDPQREQLFAAPRRLLSRLQSAVGEGQVEWLSASEGRPEPLQHLLDNLFLLKPEATDPSDNLQLLAAPGVLAEVREIMREVKTILLDGTRPGDIGLIFRSLDEYRRPLQETAREMGLPLLLRGKETLSTRPSVQVVLDLLQVIRGDYRQADVVKLLKSNFISLEALQDGEPVQPEDVEWVACEARIIAGRENWQRQLSLYANRLRREFEQATDEMTEDDEGSRIRPRWQVEAERLLLERCAALFSRLATRLDRLTSAQTRREHVRRLLELLSDLQVPRRLVHAAAPHETAANVAAYQQLLDALRAYAQAEALLPAAAASPISFETFCAELTALCDNTTFDGPPPQEGCILASDVLSARQVRKPYLFIGGLVEGSWPQVRREQPFFDDRERLRLSRDGIALALSSEQQQDEAYLFYLACAAAERRLYLSYPTVDPEGQPLPPTHYVEEVTRAFLPDTLPVRQRKLSDVVVEAREVASLRELLERVQKDEDLSLWSLVDLPDGRSRTLADHAFTSAAVEKQRNSFDPLECHDGILSSPAIHSELTARYGPTRPWSATALGTYGTCPFRFLLDRVLHLETVELPGEEVEALDLGTIIHRILHNFFLGRPVGQPLSPAETEAETARMDALVDQFFGEWENRGLVTHRALWRLAREQARRDLRQLVQHEIEKMGDYAPRAFEANYRAELPPDEGEVLLIHGKMDRVDVTRTGEAFAVYDYKGGDGNSPNSILSGSEFQMPFYTLGAKSTVFAGQDPPPECTRWAYYRYKKPVRLSKIVSADAKGKYQGIQDYVTAAVAFAYRHVRSLRRGQFPLNPQSCDYCDFSAICRYTPHRLERKLEEVQP
ncbi:MAG: PD-(D/E)XK nuclease family protein [Armatimonadia bacterium]